MRWPPSFQTTTTHQPTKNHTYQTQQPTNEYGTSVAVGAVEASEPLRHRASKVPPSGHEGLVAADLCKMWIPQDIIVEKISCIVIRRIQVKHAQVGQHTTARGVKQGL